MSTIGSQLRVEPTSVEFGSAAIGQRFEKVITVTNDSRARVDVEWAALPAPFAVVGDGAPTQLEQGPANFVVSFAPTTEGEHTAALTLSTAGTQVAVISLHGAGRQVECHSIEPCRVSTMNLETGLCETSPAPNGSECNGENACVTGGHCVSGECRGDPLDCSDADHCTTDGCTPGIGCVHLALVCPGAGPCQAGSCDPQSGCKLNPVADGVTCGPRRNCFEADVCISGECVVRDPPDGFVCSGASPCESEGVCVDDVCVQPKATKPLKASWVSEIGSTARSDMMLTDTDDLILSSYFTSGTTLKANRPNAMYLGDIVARRCIVWAGRLACADRPNAGVTLFDLETGASIWEYTTVRVDVPSLAMSGLDTFLARLVVVAPNRLGVLFESRTVGMSGEDTSCRVFTYVILNELGQAVAARRIEDPIFDLCAHPHSFGVATDATGNLYVSFSYSGSSNPARPIKGLCSGGRCQVLMSFSPKAELRWVMENVAEGELSVGNDFLFSRFHEVGVGGLSGANPVMVSVNQRLPFGLGVITAGSAIGRSEKGVTSSTLNGLLEWWTPSPSPTTILWASDLHTASLSTPAGPRSLVVGIEEAPILDASQVGPQVWLTGLDLASGEQVFRCPLEDVRNVAAFEIGKTGMAVMSQTVSLSGSTLERCDDCDPRFAQTRNRFQWFDLPTLSGSPTAWSGTNSDPGHSHHERVP